MRKSVKRVIAGVLSAVLSLSLVNFSALSMSFASELSGYEIGVEYSEDNTSATLVGNTTGVKEDVQLDKLVDSDGQELDPTSFSQTVEENGTYHFTLYYQEAVDTQGADQPTTEEKTQKLEVVVNGIVEPESQEAPAADAEAGTEQEDPVTEMPALPTGDPMTAGQVVPLDVLLKSAAESRATKKVQIYAYETEYMLREENFSGGALVNGAEGLPTASYRTFKSAAYVLPGSTTKFYINGLYFYNNQWYYTVGGNSDSSTGVGNVSAGFVLPTNATVRLYYQVIDDTKHELFFSGGNGNLANDYKLTVNGGESYVQLLYPQGRKIVLEFILPPKFSNATISIPEISYSGNIKGAAGQDTQLKDNTIKKVSDYRYTLVFTMPNEEVHINFSGTAWPDNAEYSVCLGSGIAAAQGGEHSTNTYFKTTGGTTTPATVTHTDGYYSLNGGTINYSPKKLSLPTGTNQSKDFAEGKYRAGSTVTMELNMDRWRESNPYFVWKPVVLVMQVYLGTNFGGQDYTRYYIPLVTSQGGSKTTPLDFGATVTTTCKSWASKSFTYTITVKNMYHNFAIYDVETSTNQQNFVIENVNGIDLSTSMLENKNGTHTLRQWDIWLGKDAKVGSYSMNFFIDSKEGYTAPTLTLTNPLAECELHPHGYYKHYQYGYHYWWEVEVNKNKNGELHDDNKAPALISITAQPLSFAVKYYYNGKPYHNPEATMSIDKGTNYGIMYKIPDGMNNVKGYYVNVFSNGNQIANITKSDGTNVWYPNKDVISYSQVYNQLKSSGKLPTNPSNCELRIVPIPGSAGQGYVTTYYTVKFQSAFQQIDNTSADNHLSAGNFTPRTGTFKAYVGSAVTVSGYEDQVPLNGKKYKLNSAASTFGVNKVTANGTVATLEYVLATTATMKTSTLGTGNNYDSWKSNIEGKWFTSIGNFDHIIDITDLKAGTKDGMVFDEWEIRAGNTAVKLDRENMVWHDDQTGKDYLSLPKIGKSYPDLWSQIFNTGTMTLEATWKSAIEPIRNTQGDNALVTNTPAYVVGGDTAGFEISGVFKYGTKTVVSGNTAGTNQVTLSEIQKKIADKSIKLVVLKKNANADPNNNPWTLWYSENAAQPNKDDAERSFPISLKETTVDADSGGFKVTFNVKKPDGENTSPIAPAYEDGAVYRIFAWSKANGTTSQDLSNLTGTQVKDAMNGNNLDILGLFPCVKTDVKVLEQVTLAGGGLTNEDGGAVYFVEDQEGSLSITGEFKYGDGNTALPDIQKMLEAGALKIALIKKNPSDEGGAWQARFGPGTPISNGFGGPTITQGDTAQTFKVTFTVNGPIGAQWNDGANFRIFAWTAAHNGKAGLQATQIATALTGNDNPYDGEIPSVNVPVIMLRKVTVRNGETEGLITDVPNKNVYIKNGASSFQITADFKYGDGTATVKELEKMVEAGALKIALVKKNPPGQTQTWQARSGPGMTENTTGFVGPVITKEAGSSYFKITFTVNQNVTKEWNDGANFKIFAWTAAHEGMANLQVSQIATALTNADGTTPYVNPYEGKVPSVNTTTYWLYGVKNEGGVDGPVKEKALEVYDGTSFQLTSNFRYGDSTADQTKLNDLFDDGALKVVLLKKDPQIGETPVKWADRYGGNTQPFGKPTITKAAGSDDFTVSFTVDKSKVTGQYNDGAQFRILVWTDVNATNTDGTSITVTNILDVLNETEAANKPNINGIPWEQFNLSMLYLISAEEQTEETVTAKVTDSNVVLTTTFHYDYDVNRYPNNSFTKDMLDKLMTDGDIQVSVGKKGSASDESWTPVAVEDGMFTTDGAGNITFTYTISNTDFSEFLAYNGNQFEVSVWTDANGETHPSHTFTVNVSLPEVYSVGGSIGNTPAKDPIKIKDGQAENLTVTAEFMYEDGTTPVEDIDKMVTAGIIKIALLIKDPTTGGSWQVRYPVDGTADFAGPDITAGKSETTFQVTFTEESSQLTGKWSDGAEFLIYAWTETNQANLTAEAIVEALNTSQEEKPYESLYAGEVPSVYTYTTKLYKITTDQPGESTVTADVLDGSLTLTTTFHYNYDTNRYPNGTFTKEMLDKLMSDGEIKVSVEKKTSASDETWSTVQVENGMFTTDGQGNITFTYVISGTDLASFLAYDGNQFKVTVWTDANGEPYPSHTFTVNVTVDAITNEGGASSSQPEKVEGNVGGGLGLEAKFRYGDGTATLEQIEALIDAGVIKIALLKIDPDLEIKEYTVSWRNVPYDGSDGAIPEPKITQKNGSTDFTVTFEQVSKSLNGIYDDGARFRMYVWTDANDTNEDGSSITIDQIASDLNKVEGGAEATITALPWVHYNLSLLYKVTNNSGDVEDTIEVLSTATSIQLSGTFKYAYDGTRYWKGFSAETLKTLIDGNKFSSKIEYQKKGETGWTQVPGAQVTLTAADSGIMNFSYAFTDASGTLEGYDGAKFKVTVWTDANGTDESTYPVYTITVTYIADPSTYVNIPQYIILEDDKSNVVVNGNKQDGYAGKSDQVSYKTSAGTQVKPEVTVKIKSGVKLRQGSHTGPEMQDMGIGIYDGAGKEINPESNGYSTLGTLSESNPKITFWMNVWRGGAMKNEQYYATVDYLFEVSGTTT